MLDDLLYDVETLLRHNRVHGDLSPFNVLVHDGRARIIDFPQAVDPRMNRNACNLLFRDVENLCRHFARCGVDDFNPSQIAGHMWGRFVRGEL